MRRRCALDARGQLADPQRWHSACDFAYRIHFIGHGDLAQLVEHRFCKAGVRGSIPLVSTKKR